MFGPTDTKSCKGDDIIFSCEVTKEKYSSSWMVNNAPITNDRYKVTADGCKRFLKISQAEIEDSGEIKVICEGQEAVALLTVVPIGIEIPPQDFQVVEKEMATFVCVSNKAGVSVCYFLISDFDHVITVHFFQSGLDNLV